MKIISNKCDINKNGWIDAYDISGVSSQLEGGVQSYTSASQVSGSFQLITSKQNNIRRETIEITVKGIILENINAMSSALHYNQNDC
ncbi:MAG: hypothetical protein ABI266_08045 [Ginsengibacter sp.]